MRIALCAALILALGACRAPYLSELADLTVLEFQIPSYGTPGDELNAWFDQTGFDPRAKVYQAESELRRLPGTPYVYALEAERTWWLTRAQTVKDFCTTQKIVYYKLDDAGALARAILTSRSQC
ncbi:MAG: hypothetical protein AAGK00_00835 [Pseudomonadota bacterium]